MKVIGDQNSYASACTIGAVTIDRGCHLLILNENSLSNWPWTMFLSVLLNDDSCMKRAVCNGNQLNDRTTLTLVMEPAWFRIRTLKLPTYNILPNCGNDVSKHDFMRFLRSINFRKKIRHAEGFVIVIESASLAESRLSLGCRRRKWDREVAQARYEVFIVGRARNHLKVVLSLDISLLYLPCFRHPSRSSVGGDANCMLWYRQHSLPFTTI